VTNWQHSLAENPVQLQALLFLGRGNYDLARYQAGLDAANDAIKATGLNSVLANAYSLAGDCYSKLGQDQEARRCYGRSIKMDNDVNLWAATGLIGN
jgi:tetratricopeptide (TPR) repeat protein